MASLRDGASGGESMWAITAVVLIGRTAATLVSRWMLSPVPKWMLCQHGHAIFPIGADECCRLAISSHACSCFEEHGSSAVLPQTPVVDKCRCRPGRLHGGWS
jgi:hypothetical protein